MVLNSIEKLLEKYDNGETTLKEEQQLKAYFQKEDVPAHLESYKAMFQYFNTTKQELYTKDVPLKPRKNYIYQWISVAAVAILMLGIFVPKVLGGDQPTTLAQLSAEEREMYYQTQEALALLGANFQKGTSSVNALGLVSDNLDQGASSLNALQMASENFNLGVQNASFVNKFGKTTNKLLKNTERKQVNN